MIQGDETREQSSESASFDPLDSIHLPLRSHNSGDGDESPIHSHYSSFQDSEFERYCSANSVMGTPSSVGDREFGLLRGSGLGDISSSFENFRLEGEFAETFRERLSSASRSIGFSSHKIDQGVAGNDGFRTCDEFNSANSIAVPVKDWSELTIVDLSTLVDEELCIEDDFGGIVRCRDCSHLGSLQSSVGTLPVQQTINGDSAAVNVPGVENDIHQVESHLDELHSHSDVGFEREEGERFSNEDEDLSGFEHSDGEDSMSGYATDDDLKLEFSNQENMHCYQEPKIGKGNGLLLSSSVAFGSDDWDNFIHENGPSDVTSIMLQKRGLSFENEKEAISLAQTASDSPVGGSDKGEVMDVSVSSNQAKGACQLRERSKNTYSTLVDCVDSVERKHGNDAEDICIAKNETVDLDELTNYHENHICSDVSSVEHKSLSQRLPFEEGLNASGALLRERIRLLSTRDSKDIDGKQVSESQESADTILHLDPILDAPANQFHSVSTKRNGNPRVDFFGEALLPVMIDKHYDNRPMPDSPASLNLFQSHQKTVKTDNIELHDHCDELVHEMEEVLLHSIECLGTRFTDCDRPCQGRSPLPLGDGGSTASTSGTDDAYPLNQPPVRINGIEVIGAKQRKGDVSFGERLVGVKEYTVYVIRVWNGEDHWEVKRRYRDFCTLHRRLKSLFTAQGWVLPPPWSLVERESRKIFGNVSPDVVAERSALIQECLQSILSHQFPSSLPSALIWFLSPQKNFPSSLLHNAHDPQSPFLGRDRVMTFGKTIRLIVEIHPYKSIKQILEDQHFTCAACHKHFDDGKNRMLEFVQTLGWGKPRLCEYTGQLFCSSCHTHDIAVLPARVLHHWDFTQFPVSQMAKSYLDSIHDKPMLCVSAVNPFLFSKVPALQQVTVVRKRIALMLPFVRCPFRMSIFKGLSSRRYLLESNDFFALRDLIDLSKGAFAALPVMVDTVCKKIQEHITEQCLVCCDAGIPCNARQACKDPSALIFPFQEGEIERCWSCKSVFHMPCFKKILNCPCGESLKLERDRGGPCHGATSESNGTTLDLFGRKSDPKPTLGFFSGLFSKAKHGKLLGPKDGDTTVISMGSLPSTSLR